MLKTFRDNFKRLKWILWGVIAVFIVFVFVDWGMGSAGISTTSEVVAEVGKHRITVSEFQKEYQETEQRYRQMYGGNLTPEMIQAMNLPTMVVNSMVDRYIFHDEATRLGISVSDEEVMGRILKMKDSQGRLLFSRDGAFVGQDTYRRMLAGAQLTPAAFEASVRDEALLEKLNRFFTESSVVSDQEVRDEYANRNVKAKISYVLLPAAGQTPAISDAEAEAYFKAKASDYNQPEKRKAKYLLVDTAKVRETVKITDDEVAADYTANASQYKKSSELHARHILYKSDGKPESDEAAKTKAEAALKRLRSGADFAAIAREESEDPGSKPQGGDLGNFGRGQMVKEFEDAAFNARINEIVGPVKTAYGFHIIQVLETFPERVQPLAEVAPAIRMRLADRKAQEEGRRRAQSLAERVAKLGKKPSDDELRRLTDAIVTFNESEFVTKDTPATGIGALTFNDVLFGLEAGEVSATPVSGSRGEVIIKLAEIKKPGPPSFADVKTRVIGDLARKKQDEATLETMKQAVTPGASIEDIAATLKMKVETPEAFPKSGPIPGLGNPKAVLDGTFAANAGDLKGPVLVQGRGAVVFKVLEKGSLDEKALEAEKDAIKERLKSMKSSRLMQALLTQKKNEMKVRVNADIVSRFGGRG